MFWLSVRPLSAVRSFDLFCFPVKSHHLINLVFFWLFFFFLFFFTVSASPDLNEIRRGALVTKFFLTIKMWSGKGVGFAFSKWAEAYKLLFFSFFTWSCLTRMIYLQMNYFNNRVWVTQNTDDLDPISAAVKVTAWVWLPGGWPGWYSSRGWIK